MLKERLCSTQKRQATRVVILNFLDCGREASKDGEQRRCCGVWSLHKEEFPPLLSEGLHLMELEQLKEMCVAKFPLSRTREPIMIGLQRLVAELEGRGVETAVWVDGSFVTEKINPEDADVVLCTDGSVFDEGTDEQRAILHTVNANLKDALNRDSYLSLEYPQGHPLHEEGQRLRRYWLRQFGTSRSDQPKGIAVVRVARDD